MPAAFFNSKGNRDDETCFMSLPGDVAPVALEAEGVADTLDKPSVLRMLMRRSLTVFRAKYLRSHFCSSNSRTKFSGTVSACSTTGWCSTIRAYSPSSIVFLPGAHISRNVSATQSRKSSSLAHVSATHQQRERKTRAT